VDLVRHLPIIATQKAEQTLVVHAGVLLRVIDHQHVLGALTWILVCQEIHCYHHQLANGNHLIFIEMESSYVAIANSINNLAAHQLIRRPNDVNSEIIRTIQEKNVAARNGGNNELLFAFDEKLKDLNDELEMARSFHRSIVNNLRNQTNEESEPTDN
jgi:hypothetical protein